MVRNVGARALCAPMRSFWNVIEQAHAIPLSHSCIERGFLDPSLGNNKTAWINPAGFIGDPTGTSFEPIDGGDGGWIEFAVQRLEPSLLL